MVKEVIWSPLATETFDAIVDYIFTNFGKPAAVKFIQTVEAKLKLIKTRPKMFRRSGEKTKYLYYYYSQAHDINLPLQTNKKKSRIGSILGNAKSCKQAAVASAID
ncbi:MAG: type II toxin-antitoxin system RelE/ParE family toxin [Bacteroidota bacterium]|nr:type II toxin-antitoxin system RelE/ParE family toxin [Bacteroidota bacterium]